MQLIMLVSPCWNISACGPRTISAATADPLAAGNAALSLLKSLLIHACAEFLQDACCFRAAGSIFSVFVLTIDPLKPSQP